MMQGFKEFNPLHGCSVALKERVSNRKTILLE